MKLIAPDYYPQFKCIADKCRHSCCIGWEIDIDNDTAQYYRSVKGEFGQRLKDSISADDVPHFCLDKDDRCPFLNKNGLCDIITVLGEEALCDICAEHPRYRSFYSDREEIGIGLSCEAAAMLLLSKKDKTRLICLEQGDELLWQEECDFLDLRDDIWDILQNRTKPVDSRVREILELCEITETERTVRQWVDFYRALERLDGVWDKMLDALEKAQPRQLELPCLEETETAFEQLLWYFIYRHLAESLDDGRFKGRILFAVQSYRMIRWLAALYYNKHNNINIEILAEIVRIYSAEIEYSTDNIYALIEENS